MNYVDKAYDLFDEWANEPNSSKKMIRFLVEQLCEDVHWLKENINKTDKEMFIAVSDAMKGEE